MTGASSEDAVGVVETFLSANGRAFMDDDFSAFARHFRLPVQVETFAGVTELRTEAALRQSYDGMRQHFAHSGVKEMLRMCVKAEFTGPDRIGSSHVTYLLDGTTRIEEPYLCTAVFEREKGDWKVSAMSFAVDDRLGHAGAILHGPVSPAGNRVGAQPPGHDGAPIDPEMDPEDALATVRIRRPKGGA